MAKRPAPRRNEARNDTATVAFRDDPQRQQRMRSSGPRRRRTSRAGPTATREKGQRRCRRPAVGACLGEAVDEAHQAERSTAAHPGRRSGSFPSPGSRARSGRRRSAATRASGTLTSRHHRHEAYCGQKAAGQDADRTPGARHGAVGAERLGPLRRIALERDGQDGQRRRCHQGGETHPGERARRRACAWFTASPPSADADANPIRPDGEHALAAAVVGDPAAEEQQTAERQRVGRDHPLTVGDRDVQGVLRRGQCDRHDGRVQHHHQLATTTTARIAQRLGSSSSDPIPCCPPSCA